MDANDRNRINGWGRTAARYGWPPEVNPFWGSTALREQFAYWEQQRTRARERYPSVSAVVTVDKLSPQDWRYIKDQHMAAIEMEPGMASAATSTVEAWLRKRLSRFAVR